VIENPRTGNEFYLAQDIESAGLPWSAAVLNDGVDTAVLDLAGGIARQTAGAEPGNLFLDFIGPATNFPGATLPTELNLEDWPLVEFEYSAYDPQGNGEFIISEQLAAEIYSLTPIDTPFQPADYNYDDIVDSVDLFAWTASFGNTVDLYADGNLDGSVNAADYVLWRKAYEQSIAMIETPEDSAAGSHAGVPEPNTAWLLVFPLALAMIQRHSRGRIPHDPRHAVKVGVVARQVHDAMLLKRHLAHLVCRGERGYLAVDDAGQQLTRRWAKQRIGTKVVNQRIGIQKYSFPSRQIGKPHAVSSNSSASAKICSTVS
jgi:hypothetical protein